MQRTPPPTLPRRPTPAGVTYKTLPDASKAALPPKPPIAPINFSPSKFPIQRVALTPHNSPEHNPIHYGQKRKFSHFNDYVAIPLQTSPTPKRTKYTYKHDDSHKYDGAGEFERKQHVTKTLTKSPNVTSANNNNAYNARQSPNIKSTHQKVQNTRKKNPAILNIQLIHDKLLGGATTLTKKDQGYLQYQMSNNSTLIPPLMVELVIKRVTNKTPDLSYGMMYWANQRKQPHLLESVLMDWLYNFDVNEAFDEGLMSVQQVANLMDCQITLECIRDDRIKQAQETKIQRANINTDIDAQYESDARSLSMDLSDSD
ncbi:hypothetical protein F5Y09DRAFT_340675 [Xylaria sp. FL1042]|nr:hypothetical protein F5Y09DRAFT_340675 [Xylaria sp. FL1042]